jgi:hypothetical protein
MSCERLVGWDKKEMGWVDVPGRGSVADRWAVVLPPYIPYGPLGTLPGGTWMGSDTPESFRTW